ncbi:MAG TPA: MFS transporter [Mycobacteriales bacterium]|nr:MFS transporter [Mycobacteriales bacterium]
MSTTTLPTDKSVPAGADPAAAVDRRRWIMLAVLVTGQFMALLDATIVNVAMPTIGADLHASGSALQLIISGYTITYAMLLITAARLGNTFGTRNLFLGGLVTFTLASLACGLAPTTGLLIAARFVQGAGAAGMVPQIFSVIQREFTGAARTRALSVYATVIAVGAVAGQIVGGVIVTADLFGTGWRPVFLLNVPIGLALAVLVPRLVPAGRVPGGRRVDLVGLVTASAAVLLIVLPLVLGREQGWPAWTWLSLVAGLLLAAVFVQVERGIAARGGDPLLNLNVLRAPGMTAGVLALAAGMVTYGGFLFTLALHLQLGLGDTALRAGLTFAPAAATFGLVGYFWRRLPAGVHHAVSPTGLALAAVGYFGVGISLHAGGSGEPWLTPTLVLLGIGFGGALSPILSQALVRVPVSAAADASGLLTTTMQLAQVIGIAVYGTLFLNLAGRVRPHASAHAITQVYSWLSVLALAGMVGALVLARTVRAATRATAGG